MAVDVRAEIDIARPAEDVFAYATDANHDPEWISGIKTAKILEAERVGPGVQVERVASFLGRRIEYVNEVVDYTPPNRLAMRSVKSPFPMRVTYEFEPLGATTRARIRVEGDAGGFYGLASPLLSRMVKRSIGRDLKNLKSRLER